MDDKIKRIKQVYGPDFGTVDLIELKEYLKGKGYHGLSRFLCGED